MGRLEDRVARLVWIGGRGLVGRYLEEGMRAWSGRKGRRSAVAARMRGNGVREQWGGVGLK